MSNNTNSDTSSYYSDDSEESIDWTGNIINNRYLLINKIGSGSYCSVWNVYDIENKKYVAFKIYNTEDTEDAINEKLVMDKLRKLNIPDIILYDSTFKYEYNDEEYIIDIMPQYGYSLNDIKKLFRDIIYLPENTDLFDKYIKFIVNVMDKVNSILNILHSHNIAHTDIKPENILIDIPRLDTLIIYNKIMDIHVKAKKKYKHKQVIEILSRDIKKIVDDMIITEKDIYNYISNFDYDIKLCDMGTSLQFNAKEIYKKHTSYYKSPHIILKLPLDSKYDHWSLACTLYEMITSKVLFDPFDEELIEKYQDIEDYNLIYLITSTIGMPPDNIIEQSKLRDIFYTFDKKSIRIYDKLVFNPYIKNILDLSTEKNCDDLKKLLDYMTQMLVY